MNTSQHFATVLTQLLGNDTAVRITAEGFMPLSVETIGQSAEGNRLIAICHHGEQNGDLMRDPEMVFEVHAATSAAERPTGRNGAWIYGSVLCAGLSPWIPPSKLYVPLGMIWA